MTKLEPKTGKSPKRAAATRLAKAKPKAKAKANAKAKPRAKPSAKRAPTGRGKPARNAKRARTAKASARVRPAPAKAKPRRATAPGRRATPAKRAADGDARWLRFVETHGVVLASARGVVPNVADAIAGEPIVGSWWSHPKAQGIFDALSTIDDDVDVRCFKLVDGKVTFVHRRLWPALVRLARDGRLGVERVASIQQEHMPDGEHRNVVTPFPEWVPDEVASAADRLTTDQARAQLGAWA